MTTTKAYAVPSTKAALAPFSLERREPREHDVAIDIKYCGICHSDIHQARDEWGNAIFPMVPGHEIAGLVSAVGSKVTKYKVGDRVGVGCFVDSDRTCPQCRRGTEQYCTGKGMVLTYNAHDYEGQLTYGGYSEKIVVDENYVLRLPTNLSFEASAPLLCAGITLYSPLRHWHAGVGKKVAIIGLGGLGHMGVKLAHAMGADVTVLSQTLKKQADGKRLGADHFFATSNPDTFAELKGSFDLIINTVSTGIDWNQYHQSPQHRRHAGNLRRPRQTNSRRRLPLDPRTPQPGRLGNRRHQRNSRDARLLRPAQHRLRHRANPHPKSKRSLRPRSQKRRPLPLRNRPSLPEIRVTAPAGCGHFAPRPPKNAVIPLALSFEGNEVRDLLFRRDFTPSFRAQRGIPPLRSPDGVTDQLRPSPRPAPGAPLAAFAGGDFS